MGRLIPTHFYLFFENIIQRFELAKRFLGKEETFVIMKYRFNTVSEEQKMTIQLWMGVLLTIFGVTLLVASFLVPPLGVIHASVLAAVGEIMTFSGALIGIDYHYKYKRFEDYKEYERFERRHREEGYEVSPDDTADGEPDA